MPELLTRMHFQFQQSIEVSVLEYTFDKETSISMENTRPTVGCSYCLNGTMRCSIPEDNFSNTVAEGESGLWGMPAARMNVAFQKGVQKWLSVQIDRAFLAPILQDNELRIDSTLRRNLLCAPKPFTCGARASTRVATIVQQMVNCPFDGILLRHYIESKGIELIIEELERHALCLPNKKCCTNRKKVEEAWNLLISNLEHPKTIGELAAHAGMSESTLKRSFQKLYNSSIFTAFQSYRMVEARKLLEHGDLNVTEVAFRVGYANSSHFSRAFHRHFGFPPKSCKGTDLQKLSALIKPWNGTPQPRHAELLYQIA